MQQVSEKICVGSLEDYIYLNGEKFLYFDEAKIKVDWSNGFKTIHACKTPSHQQAVGYTGSLPSTHPHYLVFQEEDDLYLNMVDSEREFSARFTDPMFKASFEFIDTTDRPVFIHCNQGKSRSASIALAYLAKNEKIANISYEHAHKDFIKLYPDYCPGNGVRLYMINNWDWLMNG